MWKRFELGHLGKNIVVAVSLLAAGFFAAWLRFEPHLGRSGAYTDGLREYDSSRSETIRYAVWEEPERITQDVESEEGEHRPAISPDGRWIVFVSGERGTNSELYIAALSEGEIKDPRPLYALNSTYDELSPAFGGNGLYFASNRPGVGGFDLLHSEWLGDGEFAPPVALDESINGALDEIDPAPLPLGDGLAFASNRNTAGREGHDFYLALPNTEGGHEVAPMDALNSWQDDRELAFTADGRQAFFSSDRAEGNYDLYASLNEFGVWLEPEAMQGLNSPAAERGPTAGNDGFELYFERSLQAQPNGGSIRESFLPAHLFHARSLEIFQRPGRRVGWLDLLILVALLVLALLAWLAKRWDAIEVLYKCFLVSLLVHGAMMWWFRDIHPESEPVELAAATPAYHVQLAPSESAVARRSEREGELEVSPSHSDQPADDPTRQETEARKSSTEANPNSAQLARSEAPAEAAEAREVEWTPSEQAQPQNAALQDAPTLERTALASAAEASPEAQAMQATSVHSTLPRTIPQRAASSVAQASKVAPAERHLERVGRTQEAHASGSESLQAVATPLPSSATGELARADASLRAAQAADPSARIQLQSEEAGAAARLATPTDLDALAGRAGPRDENSPVRRASAPSSQASHAQPEVLALQTAPARRRKEVAAPAPQRLTNWERGTLKDVITAPLPERSSFGAQDPQRVALASSPSSNNEELKPEALQPARRRDGRDQTAPTRRNSQPMSPSPTKLAPTRSTLQADQRRPAAVEQEPKVARFEHTPYQSRFGPAKARALEEHGGTVETEAAVANGLAYLALVQGRDGSWGRRRQIDSKYGEVRVGKSGLALLAFLGAGHTPDSDSEHSKTTRKAVEFLLGTQQNPSGHFGRTNAYSHGIATYALAEAFTLGGDDRLLVPLERAVAEILRNQNSDQRDRRRFGGWGYYDRTGPIVDSWPRASITAWQVMALESARLAGIDIPDQAFEDARTFLVGCLDASRGAFRYSHDPQRLNSGYGILPGSTPASLFALSLLGEDLETKEFEAQWRYVTERTPEDYRYRGDDAFIREAKGNLYFWYYGSLASMRRGGSTWRRWNLGLQAALLDSQQIDGSWEPISVYARQYARDRSDDACYTTAMNVLSLEVYYRYFTPLLNVTPTPKRGVSDR
ncbi:MAG: hypothetical protein ACI9F9_001005 [Candidatus Paceibacteria bacterium]|jgi:hypothetical protein